MSTNTKNAYFDCEEGVIYTQIYVLTNAYRFFRIDVAHQNRKVVERKTKKKYLKIVINCINFGT